MTVASRSFVIILFSFIIVSIFISNSFGQDQSITHDIMNKIETDIDKKESVEQHNQINEALLSVMKKILIGDKNEIKLVNFTEYNLIIQSLKSKASDLNTDIFHIGINKKDEMFAKTKQNQIIYSLLYALDNMDDMIRLSAVFEIKNYLSKYGKDNNKLLNHISNVISEKISSHKETVESVLNELKLALYLIRRLDYERKILNGDTKLLKDIEKDEFISLNNPLFKDDVPLFDKFIKDSQDYSTKQFDNIISSLLSGLKNINIKIRLECARVLFKLKNKSNNPYKNENINPYYKDKITPALEQALNKAMERDIELGNEYVNELKQMINPRASITIEKND